MKLLDSAFDFACAEALKDLIFMCDKLHGTKQCGQMLKRWHQRHGIPLSNKLSPETTEKLVYVYSNSKMASAVSDAKKLKMFAWDNDYVLPVSLVLCGSCVVLSLACPSQVDTL